MRHWIMGALAAVLVLFRFPAVDNGWLRAADPDEKEKKQAEEFIRDNRVRVVTVTAAPVPRETRESAASVSVLTPGDLAMNSSQGALSALSGVPGLFVQGTGDFGRADADIRGLGQNCRRIAVLVDGKPEKMGLFGCAVSHAFPLDNVRRIEVVRGPASLLYGGEAMGGAVNIITGEPRKKFDNELFASLGAWNSRILNLKHGAVMGRFKYLLTADRRQSDGHLPNSQYDGWSLTGKTVYEPAPGMTLTLSAKYFDGEKHEPGPINAPAADYWNIYRRGATDLSLAGTSGAWTYSASLYHNFGAHRFSDGFDSHDHTVGASFRASRAFAGGSALTAGGDWRSFGGRNDGFPKGEWRKSEGSLFLYHQLFLNRRWNLSGGLRAQLDSLFGAEWCPQAGVTHHFSPRMELSVLVSKGFRSPQLNELYMFPPANPQLKPERVWNHEISLGRRFGDWLRVRGAVFYMKGSNLVEMVPNVASGPRFIFANSGSFSFWGAEAEAEAVFSPVLGARLACSLLDTGDQTRGRPGQKWDADLRFAPGPLAIRAEIRHIRDYYAENRSRSPISPYTLVNVRTAFRVGEVLELVLDVFNILDADYVVFGEFPGLAAGLWRMPGRHVMAGIRVRP